MKNKYFGKSFIVVACAVLVGVVSLGISVALGAPSYSPPGSGVSPTLNGLTITGDLDVQGKIKNSTLGIVSMGSKGEFQDVTVKANLDVTNTNTNGKNLSFRGMQVAAPVASNNTLAGVDVIQQKNDGKSWLSHPNKNAIWLWADDGVVIESLEAADSSGNAVLRIGGSSATNWLALDQDDIKSYGSALYLNRDNGKDVVIGSSTSKSSLAVYGDLVIGGATYGASSTKGSITVTGNGTVVGSLTVVGDVVTQKIVSPGTSPISVSGNLDVTGKITSAGGFGTFKRVASSFVAVPANGVAEATAACPVGTYIVSCGGHGTENNTNYYAGTKNISFSNIEAYTDNKCYARGVNNSTTTKYVTAVAICMDPTN